MIRIPTRTLLRPFQFSRRLDIAELQLTCSLVRQQYIVILYTSVTIYVTFILYCFQYHFIHKCSL
jgi:hypothetical protein